MGGDRAAHPNEPAWRKATEQSPVISGILHVLKFGCRWRDCPAMYGPHTTIYNRFNRWSKAGVWQQIFDRLVLRQSRAAIARQHHQQGPPLQRRRKRGADAQAIGCSRGGRTTKTHAVVDAAGRLIAFDLSPGQRADIRAAEPLLRRLPATAHLLADTAYDGDAFRDFLIGRGSVPVIRPHPRRKHVPAFDAERYKARNVVERAFSRLKDWRRVATRYDKLARNFQATISLAAVLIWWAN